MKKSYIYICEAKLMYLLVFIFASCSLFAHKVGMLIMATGNYVSYAEQLIESAEKFFLPNQQVTYFVFTNRSMKERSNLVCIYQERLGWPYDTMMRYHTYLKSTNLLSEQDYLFAIDADMLFVDVVGDEILGKRVATLHPSFVGKRGTYERRSQSKAAVSKKEGKHYFAGGFYGGTSKEVLRIARINASNIDEDLKRNIIAIWHDESHWNRYCIDHEPTVILSPSYCYPDCWDLPYPKKLLALTKNHNELRGDEKRH